MRIASALAPALQFQLQHQILNTQFLINNGSDATESGGPVDQLFFTASVAGTATCQMGKGVTGAVAAGKKESQAVKGCWSASSFKSIATLLQQVLLFDSFLVQPSLC